MPADVNKLAQAAGQSADAGRLQEAERLWQQVLALEPQHPLALCSLGIYALQRGGGAPVKQTSSCALQENARLRT